jgi:hypothetical protein
MALRIADTVFIRATGSAWCTADDGGCGGRGVIEKTRCSDCDNSVIDDKNLRRWSGIYRQQQELRNIEDLGPAAQTRIERDIKRCEQVLSDLGALEAVQRGGRAGGVTMSRSAENTRRSLELALSRLQKGRGKVVKSGKLTIAAVAREAGVSTATIHNRHPDFAEQIRALQGKETRRQRDQKNEQLKQARATIRELRAEILELNADLERLASINETFALENRVLRAVRDGENVTELRHK